MLNACRLESRKWRVFLLSVLSFGRGRCFAISFLGYWLEAWYDVLGWVFMCMPVCILGFLV